MSFQALERLLFALFLLCAPTESWAHNRLEPFRRTDATVQNIRIWLRQRPTPVLVAAGRLQGCGIRVLCQALPPIFQYVRRVRDVSIHSAELFIGPRGRCNHEDSKKITLWATRP
ncbi:MAG: hypothetical protein EPN23_03875 [Verrucomicrobia bacterium]|nr:MAG: hypothetical protein EPN23_03875 [Verrucomicrobiota bacterium]